MSLCFGDKVTLSIFRVIWRLAARYASVKRKREREREHERERQTNCVVSR